MELEIGIEDILKKERIESDRIEFKEGWNPDDIYRSICAFANDYNNEGGGYIIVGVQETEGMAVRPVKGIPENKLDEIQRQMLNRSVSLLACQIRRLLTAEPITGLHLTIFHRYYWRIICVKQAVSCQDK